MQSTKPSITVEIKHRRQSQALRSLSRVPPSSEEAQVLHEFWLKFGKEEETWKKSVAVDGKERVWMGETMVEKTMLMFPQERKCVLNMLRSTSSCHY